MLRIISRFVGTFSEENSKTYNFVEVNGQGSSPSQSFYKELLPVVVFGLKTS